MCHCACPPQAEGVKDAVPLCGILDFHFIGDSQCKNRDYLVYEIASLSFAMTEMGFLSANQSLRVRRMVDDAISASSAMLLTQCSIYL